ncbi:MAG: transglutaminase family protein [Chloroflexota bacterium]
MRIRIHHSTRLEYDGDVVEGVMDVRLGPFSDPDQRWDRYDLSVRPSGRLRRYRDGFDNVAHLITIPRSHRYVEVIAAGEVITLVADPFEPIVEVPRPLTPSERADYQTNSRLVPLSDSVRRAAERFRGVAETSAFDATLEMSRYIRENFEYRSDVTHVHSTVDEVLRVEAGVCQDFAHVLLGMARCLRIPARYVSGYIATDGRSPREGAHRAAPPRGAGASHAWVEAYSASHGWRGFDPTNNLLASEFHVKMAMGRDYADVPPSRGTYRGEAEETLAVEVVAMAVD